MTTAEIEIRFPGPPPDDIHALVWDQFGVVAEVKGPERTVDGDTVVVFLAAQFAVGMLEQMGAAAGTRLWAVLGALRRRRPGTDTQGGTDVVSASAVLADPPPREVRVVLPEPVGIVAVFDDAAQADDRAGAELLRLAAVAERRQVVMRWDAARGSWSVDGDGS